MSFSRSRMGNVAWPCLPRALMGRVPPRILRSVCTDRAPGSAARGRNERRNRGIAAKMANGVVLLAAAWAARASKLVLTNSGVMTSGANRTFSVDRSCLLRGRKRGRIVEGASGSGGLDRRMSDVLPAPYSLTSRAIGVASAALQAAGRFPARRVWTCGEMA